MTSKLLFAVTLLSALGCGLIGGVFFAFSTFVMKALAAIPSHQGTVAMKSINVAVLDSALLAAFLGTPVASVMLAFSSLLTWQRSVPLAFLLAAYSIS